MIKYSLIISLTVLVLVCCAYGRGGKALIQNATPPQQEAELWVEQNYAEVLDSVLPKGDIELEKFPENAKWVATVRIVPSSEDLEFRFSVHRAYDGKVTALITEPRKAPIKAQLRELKRNNPNAATEQIIKLVAIQQWTLTQERCPQLTQLAKEFESLRISPVLNDELMLDAVSYVMWSQAQWGDRMQVRLRGPGPKARRQSYSLIQWIENFRAASKVCMANVRN